MTLPRYRWFVAILALFALEPAACGPSPAESPTDNDDDDSSDDDDASNESDDDDDSSDDVSADAWYGCADLDDCFYLCRDDDDCVDRCRYDTPFEAREPWAAYRACMNDACGEFTEDSEKWNICMDDNCAEPRDACMTDRGKDPNYAEVGPDSNEIGEIATNIFWYDPDDKDHCLRDDFYKDKKAIILAMGALW